MAFETLKHDVCEVDGGRALWEVGRTSGGVLSTKRVFACADVGRQKLGLTNAIQLCPLSRCDEDDAVFEREQCGRAEVASRLMCSVGSWLGRGKDIDLTGGDRIHIHVNRSRTQQSHRVTTFQSPASE
jgi:hypothetical protein